MSDSFYESYAVYSQVVAAILFVIAMVVIWNRYMAPAVIASVEKKNLELAETEKRRDEAKIEADAAQAEIQAAGRDAADIGVRADRDAVSIADRIVTDARAEASRMQRAAEGELERSRYAARVALRTEIVNKAVAIARENATKLDDTSNRRLVADATKVTGAG